LRRNVWCGANPEAGDLQDELPLSAANGHSKISAARPSQPAAIIAAIFIALLGNRPDLVEVDAAAAQTMPARTLENIVERRVGRAPAYGYSRR
jgi:hypothetical protein